MQEDAWDTALDLGVKAEANRSSEGLQHDRGPDWLC